MDEFELISTYFKSPNQREDVLLGSGDDAAVLALPEKKVLHVSMDTLIEDIHFPKDTEPFDIGFKAVATALSDLAAMGARPAWITASLTLTEHQDEAWIASFSKGFFALFQHYPMQLVGGDLTRGSSLSMTLQVHGFTDAGQYLKQSSAKPGDLIYVTGTLGDAALGLSLLQTNTYQEDNPDHAFLLSRLNQPAPRIEIGQTLLGVANACIDLSDGLGADLSRLLTRSGVGGKIDLRALPASPSFKVCVEKESQWDLQVNGGDDYELCFTVSQANHALLKTRLNALGAVYHCIGCVTREKDMVWEPEGQVSVQGFNHFKEA